jgi:hypothetical protein
MLIDLALALLALLPLAVTLPPGVRAALAKADTSIISVSELGNSRLRHTNPRRKTLS